MKQQDYGTVEYKGKTLTVTQQPYAELYVLDTVYTAHAIDEEGNDYKVFWPIICEDFYNLQDESDACDWTDYKVVKVG